MIEYEFLQYFETDSFGAEELIGGEETLRAACRRSGVDFELFTHQLQYIDGKFELYSWIEI